MARLTLFLNQALGVIKNFLLPLHLQNKRMKSKTIKILKCLLVALLVSYYCESTLFFHKHTFEWGTITHSHPYLPNEGHSHTATECQTIEALTNLIFVATSVTFCALVFSVTIRFRTPGLHSIERQILENISGRAPPLSIC